MTTEAQPKDAVTTPETPTKVEPSPVVDKTSEVQVKSEKTDTLESPKSEIKVEPKAKALDDDDEEPPTTGEFTLSERALKSRLDRHLKKALKDAIGTDSLEALRELKRKQDEADAKAEELRLASLTETQREKELREKAEQERDTLKSQIEEIQVNQMVREQAREVSDAASQFFKPKYVKTASRDFADHIRDMDDAAIEALPDDYISKWMDKYAKENPELSLASETKKSETEKEKVTRIPVSNGATVQKPMNGGKIDTKPKSDKEWAEFKQKSGFNF